MWDQYKPFRPTALPGYYRPSLPEDGPAVMRLPTAVLLFVVLGLLALSCGDDSDTGSAGQTGQPTSSSKTGGVPAKAGSGSCQVDVTGDVTVSFKGQGGSSAVGTDYWLTEDEIRTAVSLTTSLGSNASDADKKKAIDEAMKKDPRFYLLIINCMSGSGGSGNTLSLMPSGDSKYADVPFKPGQYTVASGGLLGGAEKPGDFSVLFGLGEDSYRVTQDGKLNITKFDKTGIAGTFNFTAEQGFVDQGAKAKKISVSGQFDFPCTGGGNCKK